MMMMIFFTPNRVSFLAGGRRCDKNRFVFMPIPRRPIQRVFALSLAWFCCVMTKVEAQNLPSWRNDNALF